MSDNNDSKFQREQSNSTARGLDEQPKIHDRFNLETERGQRIAEASPEAQKMIQDQITLEDRQMENEQRSQARSHEFRVLKERDKLTREFFESPQPIPSDPAAKQVIHQNICEQADRRVNEREAYYRDQISKQTDRNVDEILKMDFERQQGQQHDPDQDWERE